MAFPLSRISFLAALLLGAALPARAQFALTDGTDNPPRFEAAPAITGSATVTGTSPYADYHSAPYTSLPVGKTLVVPVVVSGSGPFTFSATSSDPGIIPIVKTGYPLLKIDVSYAGTSGTAANGQAFQGSMYFALLRDMAPTATGYIAGLAESGSYNGLNFFRIANLNASGSNGYIAQTGDPANTGSGSFGFSFDNELNASLIFSGAGQLALANAGTNPATFRGTNGGQFFLTEGPQRDLDFNYTIFGQLVRGFDIMRKIMAVPLAGGTSASSGAVTTGTATQPTVPVTMTNVTVLRNDSDAILLLNASRAVSSPALVTVTALSGTQPAVSGTANTPRLTFNIFTPSGRDIVNDPPIIQPQENQEIGLRKTASIPIRTQDLEFDYLIKSADRLGGVATVQTVGSTAVVKAFSFEPLATATVGLEVYQPLVNPTRPDLAHVTVGLGDGKLTPLPLLLASGTAESITGSLGQFLDSDPRVTSFSAVVNYGDGSPLVTASNTAVTHSAGVGPTGFNVMLSGSASAHQYTNPGIYPLNVTVTDTNGGVLELHNTAVVSGGPVYALGRTFTAAKGLANTQIASFTAVSGSAADFSAKVNWGDGVVTTGTVRAGTGGQFFVSGRHQYTAGTTYPVDVSIVSGTAVATAWSVANLSGVPAHQPPFAQAHLVGQIGNPGYNSARSINEEVTILNTGNLNSGPVELEFFLSPTQSFDPSTAIPLTVANNTTYRAAPIPAGGEIRGTVSNIFLPVASGAGQFLVMVILYSDPIQSHMASPNYVVDGSPLL